MGWLGWGSVNCGPSMPKRWFGEYGPGIGGFPLEMAGWITNGAARLS
jgi:hypothetical protein